MNSGCDSLSQLEFGSFGLKQGEKVTHCNLLDLECQCYMDPCTEMKPTRMMAGSFFVEGLVSFVSPIAQKGTGITYWEQF